MRQRHDDSSAVACVWSIVSAADHDPDATPAVQGCGQRSGAWRYRRGRPPAAATFQRLPVKAVLWKITCEEHRYPGLWQQWYRSQAVSLGWPPGLGFRLSSSGRTNLGWHIARNGLNHMKPGDHLFVTLPGHRVGRLGTVTGLAVGDNEWDPFVPKGPKVRHGEHGRRIFVRWDLQTGPANPEEVVALPKGHRLTGAQLRTTLSMVPRPSLQVLRRILTDPANWVPLWANFEFERSLSGYIAAYPHRLEDGLRPYPLERTTERRGPGATRMDVLLIDSSNRPVVVECKQGQPELDHLRQLRSYMRQVQRDLGVPPRGILVHGGSRKLHEEIRVAAKKPPRVDLVQHRLEVDFSASG